MANSKMGPIEFDRATGVLVGAAAGDARQLAPSRAVSSISTAMSKGNSASPTALRVWRPARRTCRGGDPSIRQRRLGSD
jgi:hypothetical protein